MPGKPELFPKSGEVGRTNDPWPAAVGDSGMPESDVGKLGRDGDDIKVLIPACNTKINSVMINDSQRRIFK